MCHLKNETNRTLNKEIKHSKAINDFHISFSKRLAEGMVREGNKEKIFLMEQKRKEEADHEGEIGKEKKQENMGEKAERNKVNLTSS